MHNFEKKIGKPRKEDLVEAIECAKLVGIPMPKIFMEYHYTVEQFRDICLWVYDYRMNAPDDYHCSMCEGTKGGQREFRDITRKILVEYFEFETYPDEFCEELAEELADTLNSLVPPSAEEIALVTNSLIPAPPAVLRFALTTREWLGVVRWLEVRVTHEQ